MSTDELLHKLGVLLGASMIISGAILGIWLLSRFPPMPLPNHCKRKPRSPPSLPSDTPRSIAPHRYEFAVED